MQRDYRTAGFVRLCFEKLLPLMVLNLLFLLTCLPVLTAPAGWTALCRACQSLLLEENQPYRRFLNSFRANFLPSLPLGLLFFAGPAAILYGGWFYLLQVIQPGDQTGDVPDAVAVGILKAAGINLIEHTFLPPWAFHGIVHSFTMRSSITGSAPRAAVKQGSDPPSSASQGRL